MAQNVQMYTTAGCGYCVRAEALLKRKGVKAIEEIRVDREPARREEMMTRSGGRRTVPQIFIGEAHVGGCDELFALDSAGKLDSLLAGDTA